GPNGSWMTIIAHPIFSSEGDYAGFVGGTVLLQSGSALQNTLSKLDYQEGTYFYIVDEEGTVVHHPTQDLIGTRSKDIRSVSTMLHGKEGKPQSSVIDPDGQVFSYA